MSAERRADRLLRRQVLLLEMETHRLELAAGYGRIRHPVSSLREGGRFALTTHRKLALVTSVIALVAGPRLTWLVKLLPLAAAGWRVATLLKERAAAKV